MSRIAIEGTSFYLRRDDGSLEKLLDTQGYLENYSRFMMHELHGDTAADISYPLTEAIAQVWHTLASDDEWSRILFLRLTGMLLQDPYPKKILFLGGGCPAGGEALPVFVRQFHKDNRLYWNPGRSASVPEGFFEWRMAFSEMFLPRQYFDGIVIAEPVPGKDRWPQFWEQVFLSLRWQGRLWHCQENECYDTAFHTGKGIALREWQNSKERWQSVQEDSIEESVMKIRQGIDKNIEDIAALLPRAGENNKLKESMIKITETLEEYILAIDPYLANREIKQFLAIWHENLMEWRLGYRQDVQTAWEQLMSAWKQG